MIEKIKRRLSNLVTVEVINGEEYYNCKQVDLVLDKYKDKEHINELHKDVINKQYDENQELLKYKNAWEYMFEWFNKKNVKRDTPKSLEIENFVIKFMQEIEKMNGIEVK